MRLPITDEFLWIVYSLMEIGEETFDAMFLSIPKSMRESVELNRLKKEYERKKRRWAFIRLVNYLKRNGYIKIEGLKEKKAIMLTEKGTEKLLKARFRAEKGKRRKDGKWVMIIFDIPEKERHLRTIFRKYLYLLKFKMLQQSVWICPFAVSEKIKNVIRCYSLDSYIKIFLIEPI